jgi:hypothetical protein
MFVDQLAEGGAEGKFIITRLAHTAREREDLHARAVIVPIVLYQSAPLARIIGTLVNVSTLLMMVGLPYKPYEGGNGGRTRAVRVCLRGFEQALSLHRRCTRLHRDGYKSSASIRCQKGYHRGNQLLPSPRSFHRGRRPPARTRRANKCMQRSHQQHNWQAKSFQKLEGIAFHDLAVFESARFGFIRIGNNIMRPVLIINEGPLHTGGEARTATPAQARVL